MNNRIQHFEKKINKQKLEFSIGDSIQVGFCFQEGNRKRIQFFEGIVLAICGSFYDKKILLRKPAGTYSIERTFAYNSPQIQTLKILKARKFRRSKLFYLRKRRGKASLA
uniref:Ribosomal protein L19 n=1 Tax=Glaukea argentea TaxID=2894057 RepID=A0A386B1P3_9CHLO|nr:ribosomal protein L19 [Udotea argentea]AYC65593.1 ribosomal protein L19 [Udotea argentea]